MPMPGEMQRAATKFIVFEQFEKMNTQSIRQALSEKELSWLENLQPIAGNNLTTVPGPAAQLTLIASTILSQFFAALNGIDYIISFGTDGSGWATNIANGVNVQFAPPGTFTNPDATVWLSSVLLINDIKSGYSAWNGSQFVKAGGVSMVLSITNAGTGYTSIPTVTITGGSGSGATAVATIGTPAVVAVNVINPGSQYATPPVVVFSGGGGTGAAATATIDLRSVTGLSVSGNGRYTAPPGFQLPFIFSGGGGGSGASATAYFTDVPGGFAITSISLNAVGSGYSSPPSASLPPGYFYSGSNTFTVTVGNGGVLSITVTTPGGGYTSAPTVSFTGGGGGSGATAAAVIGGSGVTSLTLTNPGGGYLASDVLTLTISGGGGTGATGTAHVWPFATHGTTLAIFQGRVWLGGGRLIQYTGTQGYDDLNVANAAGAFTISDTDLVHAVTALRNYNNYLFIMGDQSVKQIGNITVTGSTTLFTVLTLSSDQGTIYPRSCGSFNRLFLFCNTNGVYAVFGSSVQKVSDDMDGIFRLIDFSQSPVAALVDINNIHHIAWLVRYMDPLSTERSILLTFTGKKWFVISQGNGLVAMATASTLASGQTFTYATSGNDITNICENPLVPVTFKLQTALTHHGNAVQRKRTQRGGWALTSVNAGTITVSMDSEEGTQSSAQAIVPGFQSYSFANNPANVSGKYLGLTVTGTLAGFTMTNTTSEFQDANVGNKA